MDIKRKAPFYLSDFKDGMSLQCVASFLFLYCACMSPVITFGGLLGEATEGRIVRASTRGATVQVSPHHAERDTDVMERIGPPCPPCFPECHRVFIWCLDDWSRLFFVRWSASHHSWQHGSCAGV